MNKVLSKKGITIIETLLYATILIIVVGIVTQSFMSLLRLHRNTLADKLVESSITTVTSRITREIKRAESVDLSNSILNFNPGALTLTGKHEDGSQYRVMFSVNDGVLQMTDLVTGEILNVTSNKVSVSGLMFYYIENENSKGVRTFIQIETGSGSFQKSISSWNFSALRNSY